ncbi:MAG TPA: tetratricopeptide repeat protein, partial [Dongiaceae bacterium]|nr:tetratricopeptide repeat protein [Dongiaceae bacterium]
MNEEDANDPLNLILDRLSKLTGAVTTLAETARPGGFNAFAERLAAVVKLALSGAILIVAVFLAVYMSREMRQDTVEIGQFSVPDEMVKAGATSEALAQQIAFRIRSISKAIDRASSQSLSPGSRKRSYRLSTESMPEIEVPEAKVSVKSVIAVLQTLLHKEPRRAEGEIVKRGTQFRLSIRVKDGSEIVPEHTMFRDSDAVDLDTAADLFAKMALAFIEPWGFANYTYGLPAAGASNQGLPAVTFYDVLQTCERCSLAKHQAIAAEQGGLLFAERNDYKAALAAYQKAVSLDDNAYYETNKGWALAVLGKTVEAIECFQQAIRLDEGYVLADLNLAYAYEVQGNHDLAVVRSQRVLDELYRLRGKGNPRFAIFRAEALQTWGDATWKRENTADATRRAEILFREAIDTASQFGSVYESLG